MERCAWCYRTASWRLSARLLSDSPDFRWVRRTDTSCENHRKLMLVFMSGVFYDLEVRFNHGTPLFGRIEAQQIGFSLNILERRERALRKYEEMQYLLQLSR